MDRTHGWVGRKDRRPTSAAAIVRRADGTELRVKLVDFSDEGCRIDIKDGSLAIGEWVQISVASAGLVKAQVRWALGTSAGVQFEAHGEQPQD